MIMKELLTDLINSPTCIPCIYKEFRKGKDEI